MAMGMGVELPGRLAMEADQPRVTRAMGVVERGGWVLKATGITATEELPSAADVEAAAELVESLQEGPQTGGIGYLIVHKGTEALWVLVGRWELDILHQRLFRAALGTTEFEEIPGDGPTACVWELAVIDQERRAWVRHVLSYPDQPRYADYLADTVGSTCG